MIGINTVAPRDPSGYGAAPGLGSAVPTDLASDVATQGPETGRGRRAFLGVRDGDVDGARARESRLPVTEGVVVLAVGQGTAATTGIRPGDLLGSAGPGDRLRERPPPAPPRERAG